MVSAHTGGHKVANGMIGQHLSQLETSMHAELQKASSLARVCAIKGLVSFLPTKALCCPMRLFNPASGAWAAWQPLADGALPQACLAMEQAVDAQFKYHALQLLTICLQRARKILQVSPSALSWAFAFLSGSH